MPVEEEDGWPFEALRLVDGGKGYAGTGLKKLRDLRFGLFLVKATTDDCYSVNLVEKVCRLLSLAATFKSFGLFKVGSDAAVDDFEESDFNLLADDVAEDASGEELEGEGDEWGSVPAEDGGSHVAESRRLVVLPVGNGAGRCGG